MYKHGIEAIYFAYEPDDRIYVSIGRMLRQKKAVDSIKIFLTANVEDDAFEDKITGIFKNYRDKTEYKIIYIKRKDFGHGRTRQEAMDSSKYDHVLLITQDAVPVNDMLTANLYAALENEDAACSYARQEAYSYANEVEKLYRRFNYPAMSRSKTASDLEKTGIKTFFCSDVCCMYKHDIFDSLGGFDVSLKFNEDSIFAFHAIKGGYSVEYAADAIVYHSHNDALIKQFRRSRDLARSQKEHPEVFENVSSENEGIRFFVHSAKYLVKKKDYKDLFILFCTCAVKYAGYFIGKKN
ncbi:MAG: glycosyltransferase [Lachnospiraceae bacterium]|nr:glycosyltransferase [Lachnospiraceae bacterium]